MYTWEGMRKLRADEIFSKIRDGGLSGYYLLYDDGTESCIDDGYKEADIIGHLLNGGEIGEEKE